MRIEIAIKIPSTGGLQFIDADTDSYDVQDALEILGVDMDGLKAGGHCARIEIKRPPSAFAESLKDMAVGMMKAQAETYTAPLKGDVS